MLKNLRSTIKSFMHRGDGTSDYISPPTPDREVIVIGDVHGRADLLEIMLGKAQKRAPGATVVLVGDYIDRGPDSPRVLRMLQDLDPGSVCLKGNHEAMLLDFLEHPERRGMRWLRNGGTATIQSYGLSITDDAGEPELRTIAAELRERLGDSREWLAGLSTFWRSGNLWVIHAGPNPAVPIEDQGEDVFLWGHHRFLRDPRADEQWVAHGHWITEKPTQTRGRISVDTGAWKTGRLSAAHVRPDGSCEFFGT